MKNRKSPNKKYVHVKDLLKGKRNIDITKLVEDTNFMTALKKDVAAYNERLRYRAKKEEKEVKGKLYASDIKKKVKMGTIDIASFKKEIMGTLYSGYSRDFKPKKEKVQKQRVARVKRENTVLDEQWRELNKKMRGIYGSEYARRNVGVLKELKQNLKKVEKSGIAGIDTDFYKVVKELEYSFNDVERKNEIIKAVLQAGDYHKGLVDSFNEYARLGNRLREEKLDENILKYFDGNPLYAEKLKTMSYEEKLNIYNSSIKPLYFLDKEKWVSPGLVKKRSELSEVDALTLTEKDTMVAISDKDLKTSVYIDNFLRALKVMEEDEEDKLTKKQRDAFLRVINLIPKDRLADILLEDDIKIERWYKTKEEWHKGSKYKLLMENLKKVVTNDITEWDVSSQDKENARATLNKIKF